MHSARSKCQWLGLARVRVRVGLGFRVRVRVRVSVYTFLLIWFCLIFFLHSHTNAFLTLTLNSNPKSIKRGQSGNEKHKTKVALSQDAVGPTPFPFFLKGGNKEHLLLTGYCTFRSRRSCFAKVQRPMRL
jgi:hypothetical protein